jgi:hypothetical protein
MLAQSGFLQTPLVAVILLFMSIRKFEMQVPALIHKRIRISEHMLFRFKGLPQSSISTLHIHDRETLRRFIIEVNADRVILLVG